MTISTNAQFNRYLISREDFVEALKFLKESERFLASEIAYEATLISAVISFCRPFGPNELRANAAATRKINLSDVGAFSGPEVDLYDQLMAIRNKALAHSEFSQYPVALSPTASLASSRRFSIVAEPIDRNAFRLLAEKLRLACDNHCGTYALDPARRALAKLQGTTGPDAV